MSIWTAESGQLLGEPRSPAIISVANPAARLAAWSVTTSGRFTVAAIPSRSAT